MRASKANLYRADVVATFENQNDADEAVLQLRLAGVGDNHIGYFTQNPRRGLIDLIAHDRRFSGSVLGGIVGTVLGVLAARLVNGQAVAFDSVSDPFGLAVTLGTSGALFFGFVGWWLGTGVSRRSVEMPAVNTHIGAFILAVSAGALRDRAWALVRRHGGHELPPDAVLTQQIAV
jgi:hypothetical protein